MEVRKLFITTKETKLTIVHTSNRKRQIPPKQQPQEKKQVEKPLSPMRFISGIQITVPAKW